METLCLPPRAVPFAAPSPSERGRVVALPLPAARPPEAGPLGSAVLMRVLDQLDYGVMVVDEQARVRFANRWALRECAPGQPVRLVEGRLHARDDREQQGLMRALAAACHGRRALLSFAAQPQLLTVAIVPVQEAPGAPAVEATALVVFARRQACEPLSVEMFAREHHLTSAETGVLRGLAGGQRPGDIARAAGVAMSTVRTQITSIRLKTGVGSIADLVRLVTVLPPIVPVLAA